MEINDEKECGAPHRCASQWLLLCRRMSGTSTLCFTTCWNVGTMGKLWKMVKEEIAARFEDDTEDCAAEIQFYLRPPNHKRCLEPWWLSVSLPVCQAQMTSFADVRRVALFTKTL